MLQDMLVLDPDPDLFLEKTLDDLDFIGGSLAALLEKLSQHKHLIELEEQYHNLFETETRFLDLLNELARGGGVISAGRFPVIQEKIETLTSRARERQRLIDTSLEKTVTKNPEPVVSSDELQELLKNLK
jgi:hypothetical protein